MEFEQLLKRIQTFNNSESNINNILQNKLPENNAKNYRGNQYEMDQFNWQMQYMEYKKKLNDEKKQIRRVELEEVDTLDNLQDRLKIEQFSKPWGRMNPYCKKTKLTEYVQEYIDQGKINLDQKNIYTAYLYKKLKNGLLKTKKEIEYDSDTQKIISIKCLDNKLK